MLDYDSMRSKVRRLTEKPDKDASKLPRAEKEADMVSISDFLVKHRTPAPQPPPAHPAHLASRRASRGPVELEADLEVPSPPKALQRPDILKLKQDDKLHRSGSKRSSSWSLLAALAGVPSSDSAPPQRHPSRRGTLNSAKEQDPTTRETSFDSGSSFYLDNAASTSTEKLLGSKKSLQETTPRSLTPTSVAPTSSTPTSTDKQHTTLHTMMGSIPTTPLLDQRCAPSPFFNPSELEEIMAPLKREFITKQADLLQQAKAAYEQLNEQLSTELPQLIDLRVPYLDPSFEALVKIQLRFCAEAYSRMAQVQQ